MNAPSPHTGLTIAIGRDKLRRPKEAGETAARATVFSRFHLGEQVSQSPPPVILHINIDMPEGIVDVILPAAVYSAYFDVLRSSAFLIIEGQLRKEPVSLSVVAERVMALPDS